MKTKTGSKKSISFLLGVCSTLQLLTIAGINAFSIIALIYVLFKILSTRRLLIDRKSLLIPFGALDSLGASIANSIVEARNEHEFTSKKDVLKRTKMNATQFEKMNLMGVFDGLPEDDSFSH